MATGPTRGDFFVTQYFEFAFDRRPDTLGLYYWANDAANGVPLTNIASSFVNSVEFRALYGVLSNAQFVDTLQSN